MAAARDLGRRRRLALSPVHASRPVTGAYSPYSPSDRRFLDPLHAAPVRILGELALDAINAVPGLRERFDRLHDGALIDWQASAHAKWELLRQLYTRVAPDHADLVAFGNADGAALQGFARFAAQDFGDNDPQLHVFTQWLAARSWSDAQRQAHERGMKIGLIADLAVASTPMAPKPQQQQTPCCAGWCWARHRMRSMPMVSIGALARTRPPHCDAAATRRTSHCCARCCATVAVSGSITSWA